MSAHGLTFRIVAVLVLAIPGSAAAQGAPPPPPVHEGSAEFAFIGTTGNASTQSIGLGGDFMYRPAPWETRFKINYVRNEADGELNAESLILSLRAARPIRPRLDGFAAYGYQHDEFAGILGRHVIEGGLSYTVIDQAPQSFKVDGAIGYTNERRPLGVEISTATASVGGAYKLQISETSTFTEDARAVFSLSDADDRRYTNLMALTAKISSVLSLKASNTIRYLNLPAEGFRNTDTLTSVALVAKF